MRFARVALASAFVRPLKSSRFQNKQAISLTDAAAARVKELLNQKDDGAIGLRIGVQKRGCNGMSYTMNYEYPNQDKEAVTMTSIITDKGVSIYVDHETEFYITGTIMDFISNPTEEKFEFLNPNAKAVCGCNESFTV
jgi:iron-sulfur cluster assembly protein|uniref:Core domain-containing protein n=1 Tax=Eutreptiella gymnastica TaxID=73025 RepID=A0A7S4LCN7_9EUGL|mmetsp:Transcript_11878/g.21817  ORF Transcript_11878/g.21817 Transcript_11878/m.21817 type:complete len:138 (+) Transcript_11878:43-456(+)|eukprot:CAMPEP_0174303212 /NCGR_PEP_ID=MMETSP0809-20121228/60051_1 /TAXON_ID=73025 ORGANISM="Eutreptiella gymnastica-like, Strain CCMP1594" /NCGR_SAMPLE_ID=MMETSP0809 /ASSEMBLY_ACC=CAM_ASM_000658 /LENGTH=137 /DNA_ID=CAMNT_0015409195 /DNA_START=31 /DNA_END=444 /DNA_ORIENTATION=+